MKVMKKVAQVAADVYRLLTWDRTVGAFRGVYRSYDEAYSFLKSRGEKVNYDVESMRQVYLNINEKLKEQSVLDYEYPMFFWLLRTHMEYEKKGLTLKVFDFGGSFGVHFFKYLRLAPNNNFVWTVCETPETVSVAREQLLQWEMMLSFTKNLEDAYGVDVFFSSGALQHVPSPATLLGKLKEKPKYLILGRLFLQDKTKSFHTVQNGGVRFYPFKIFNESEFISELTGIGYKLKEKWETKSDSVIIPFHRDVSLHSAAGLFFTLDCVPNEG